MNKVTELLDAVVGVITNVRNLADSLQVVPRERLFQIQV